MIKSIVQKEDNCIETAIINHLFIIWHISKMERSSRTIVVLNEK